MKEDKPKEQRLASTRPLKMDRAIQIAAKRAQFQPKMMVISSKVKDFPK
jgi:hypothetical protein